MYNNEWEIKECIKKNPGGATGDFLRGSLRQNHVPRGRLSP